MTARDDDALLAAVTAATETRVQAAADRFAERRQAAAARREALWRARQAGLTARHRTKLARLEVAEEGVRPVRILSAEDLKGGFWPDMTGGLCARCHLGIIRGETDDPDPDHPECVAAHEGTT